MQASPSYIGVSNYYGDTPAEIHSIDSLYSETKILENRLNQIICLLETIARKPKEEKADVER